MDAFVESKGDNFVIKRVKEDEQFRFGPSDVYQSEHNYAIEVRIGNMSEIIKVSVVEANIPLLLGLDYQEQWGMIIDIGKRNIHIRKSGENFKIKGSRTKHWTLPIQNKSLLNQAKHLVFKVDLETLTTNELRKHITKIHKNVSHKRENCSKWLENAAHQ